MIYDVASFVFGFKCHSLIRLLFTALTDIVPFFDKLIDDIDVSPVGPSCVKFPISVIKYDRALAFKGFTFVFKMSQVYDVFVTSL